MPQARVSSSGETLVGLEDVTNFGKLQRNGRGLIGGPIVHDQGFDIWIVLAENAANRIAEIASLVVADDHYGYEWSIENLRVQDPSRRRLDDRC